MEILWKGTVFVEFRAICQKLCGNCAFPQNFHTRKLGKVTLDYAVYLTLNVGTSFDANVLNYDTTHSFPLVYIALLICCVSSNKHPRCLFNFEALKCSAYRREALKRGWRLFYMNFQNSKFFCFQIRIDNYSYDT